MLSDELTSFGAYTPTIPGSGPRNGIFANSITFYCMPTPEQFEVYSLLLRDFGASAIWKLHAEETSFDEMSCHEAAHFIGFLLLTLLGITIADICYCGRPLQVFFEAKNPALRPGSSDGSAR